MATPALVRIRDYVKNKNLTLNQIDFTLNNVVVTDMMHALNEKCSTANRYRFVHYIRKYANDIFLDNASSIIHSHVGFPTKIL